MLLWSICPSSAVGTAFVVGSWRECSQVSVDAEYFLDGNIASSTRDDGSGRDGKRSSKIVFWFVCLFQASLLFFWPYAIIPLLHVWGLHKYCCAILSFGLLILSFSGCLVLLITEMAGGEYFMVGHKFKSHEFRLLWISVYIRKGCG